MTTTLEQYHKDEIKRLKQENEELRKEYDDIVSMYERATRRILELEETLKKNRLPT